MGVNESKTVDWFGAVGLQHLVLCASRFYSSWAAPSLFATKSGAQIKRHTLTIALNMSLWAPLSYSSRTISVFPTEAAAWRGLVKAARMSLAAIDAPLSSRCLHGHPERFHHAVHPPHLLLLSTSFCPRPLLPLAEAHSSGTLSDSVHFSDVDSSVQRSNVLGLCSSKVFWSGHGGVYRAAAAGCYRDRHRG